MVCVFWSGKKLFWVFAHERCPTTTHIILVPLENESTLECTMVDIMKYIFMFILHWLVNPREAWFLMGIRIGNSLPLLYELPVICWVNRLILHFKNLSLKAVFLTSAINTTQTQERGKRFVFSVCHNMRTPAGKVVNILIQARVWKGKVDLKKNSSNQQQWKGGKYLLHKIHWCEVFEMQLLLWKKTAPQYSQDTWGKREKSNTLKWINSRKARTEMVKYCRVVFLYLSNLVAWVFTEELPSTMVELIWYI